jgi:hypothetical protein
MFVVTLDSPKTRDGGRGPIGLVLTRSRTSAFTSPTSSSSVLTSPSSRLLDSLAASDACSSRG